MKPKSESLADRRELRRHKSAERKSRKMHDEALDRIDLLEGELEAVLQLKKKSPLIRITASNKMRDSEATAIVLLSDWHVEQNVPLSMTNGKNHYSPKVAGIRAEKCFQRIVRLFLKEKQDVKLDTLLIWLGGDFITNSLRDENLETNAMPPVEAILYAKTLLTNGLRFLQAKLEGVRIVCVCSSGNHARTTDKIHWSSEFGNSLEAMMYCTLRDEHPGIEWVIEPAYNTYFKVYGRNLRFNHGHAIRYGGGIGGLTIPFIKKIRAWDTQVPADLTMIGHFHQMIAHNRFVVNGSLIGFDPYAISIGAEYEEPCQAMFLFDKKRGRSITMPILFD